MKRHVQTTGIRQWAGEDLLELQSEPLKAIDSFFAEYGNCVIRGCSFTDNGDGTFRMAPGLVALEGRDVNDEPTFMVVPFAGTDSIQLPAYLTLTHTVIQRAYIDEKVKQVAYDYKAIASSVKPEDGVYLELSADHFPRFTDVIQDPDHRFFTDTEREMLNQHDLDIERIDRKDAEQDSRLDGHDSDVIRIDKKDKEQDGRLDNHDANVIRIDKKDVEQDNRLQGHDEDVTRIDLKDKQQDGRLDGHDDDIAQIDLKDKEQDNRLKGHDDDVARIDLKDKEQDNRLKGHDDDVARIDLKDKEQDNRLKGHDDDIAQIDLKDKEQDNRLKGHDDDVARIDLKDKEQDSRLDEHDNDVIRIDLKDKEQDNRLKEHDENVTRIDLKDKEQDDRLDDHDDDVIRIDLKDKEQDNRLKGHDENVTRIDLKDEEQDDRLDDHDDDIIRIDKKDVEQDIRLKDQELLLVEHTKGENKESLNLYKITVDTIGHIQNVEKVVKKDITDLGIPAQDTTYNLATQTTNGLMSATDKTKLDGVATGANNYTHPTHTAKTAGLYKVTVDTFGHVSAATAVAKADITALGIPAQDTTYSVATATTNGLMSATDKSKLDGVATGANNYTHPTHTARAAGLYKVTVDTSGHVSAATAVAKTDITALGIPAQDTTYNVATQTTNGLMSATDKTKLDGVAAGANNYTHPAHTAKTSGLYKVTVDSSGHVSATAAVVKADITALGIPAQDTTYSVATATTNGLMSSTDKNKLDGVATGANNYSHPTYTARTAGLNKVTVDTTGHVSNVTAVTKSDITILGIPAQDTTYNVATQTANGLMSSTDKTKLDGVATGANNYTHPAYTARTAGLNKITVDTTGHVNAVTAVTKADITALGIPAQDTTYSVATTTANGLMSSTDKSKLDGVAAGANNYIHPTHTAKSAGLYKVTVDTAGHVSAVTAVTKTDITNLGIPAQDTTYGVATTTVNGLMSSTDKSKLDGVTAGANNYTHPTHAARAAGLYKVTVDGSGHVSAATAVAKTDITNLGIPAQDTTYSVATSSANGLMSSTDKSKLDELGSSAVKSATLNGSAISKIGTELRFPELATKTQGDKADTAIQGAEINGVPVPIDSKQKLQLPTIGQEFATFIVDSNQTLEAWANNTVGNDYSTVLVKAGTWTTDKGINLTQAGTYRVYGEAGNRIEIHSSDTSDYGLFYEQKVKGNEYGIFGLILISNKETLYRNCTNLNQCTAIPSGSGPKNYGFDYCSNLKGCSVESATTYSFYHCDDLVSCSCSSGSVGFYNCEKLHNCTSFDASAFCFSTSNYLTNCFANTTGGYGFTGCNYLVNCDVSYAQFGYSGCINLTNCNTSNNRNIGFSSCKKLMGCIAKNNVPIGFDNCNHMSLNTSEASTTYRSCQVTPNGAAVNSTATGGFNI